MSDPLEMLEVVDENDNVIDLETRLKIHQKGLLHREIHIWFITPNGEIIFQHRAKNKDTNPDKLSPTVGGHVEPGMSYEETAVKECKEETGIDIDVKDLVFIEKTRNNNFGADKDTNLVNNAIRSRYAYLYKGSIEDLHVEEGKAEGFEIWKIDDLFNLTEEQKKKFVKSMLNEETLALYKKAKELLIK